MSLQAIYAERMKLLPIIQGMEERGVTFSRERTKQLKTRLKEESDCSRNICLSLADGLEGTELDELPKNGRSNALNDVIFNGFKLESPKKTEKGNPSMDKYVMEHWLLTLPRSSPAYHFVKNLAQYRKRQTAIGYIDSYEKFAIGDRVPSSLNPTGTNTLRCSSSNVNLQQVGKQDDVNTRDCFGPGEGREWWAIDFENLELRIPAYESDERSMIELFERPDEPPYFGSYHLLNASIVYPDLFWPIADKKGEFKKKYGATWYQWIKNFGFSLQYGAMLGSGTADRAARKEGAQEMVMKNLSKLASLTETMKAMANRLGYVSTIPDRSIGSKIGYPVYCQRGSWGKISPTIPLSYHVQSTAMWCTCKAMVRCDRQLKEWSDKDRRGYYLAAQVHDEILFDFPKGGKDNLPKVERLKSLMEESGQDINIPLRASINYHPVSWASSVSLS
jgi:DNA polymerase I-like protein with 3'-5' exonuclease and polymerase domains